MNTSFVRVSQSAARACGVLAATVGCLGLLGWILDVESLEAVFTGGVTMKANAAVCLMLLGTALFLLTPERAKSQWSLAAGRVMAAAAMVVGGLTVAEHLSAKDFGIDQLLFREPPGAAATTSPGRMGPPASTSFFLSGLALLLLDLRTRRGSVPSQWLALLVGLIALLPLIGYAYSIQSLFGIAKYTGIALHTAVAIAVLAMGLLASRPTAGLMIRVSADDAGGEMARRLLIPAILIPLVLGWLRTVGERAGLFDAAFGRPILILSLIVSFTWLVWWNAGALSLLGRDRRRAEEDLRRSERELSDFVENATVGMHWVGPDGTILWANRAELELLGYARDEYVGQHIAKFHADPLIIEDILCRLSSGQRVNDCEARLRCKDGSIKHVLINSNVLWEDGRFVHTRCFTRDVTDQKRAEAELRESEQRLATILDNAPAMVYVVDAQGRFRFINGRWQPAFGLTNEQVVGRPVHEFFPKVVADEFVANNRRVLASRAPVEAEEVVPHADGPHTYISVKVPLLDGAGEPYAVCGISTDITERKRAEDARRASEARLRLTADAIPALVAYVDAEHRYRFVNAEYEAWFGMSPEQVIGTLVREVVGEPVYRERLTKIERALAGEAQRFEYPMPHATLGPRDTETTYVPDVAEDGTVRGFVVLVYDITERRAAERERERLLSSERAARAEAERASEAKNEFLATLSHELRTPLTPVLLTVSLMESHPGLLADLREDVATIRRNVELESRLISDLLDLTRIEKGKLELDEREVDLHLVIRSAIDICQREASAKMTVELEARLHTVRGDSTRLQQVFWNLVNNAIKFTPPDGVITVRSRNPVDGRIRVEVIDNGAGIEPAVLPRLFNAFEQGEIRAARQQAGLGLGLAISRKLAEAHGGTITAASAGRGHGATFTVDLPVMEQPARLVAAAPAPLVQAGLPTAARRLDVLLVEDHEPTLRVMERLLRHIGHRVTGVTTVASATAAAAQDGFDLIISDLGLPDGSGLDVMRKLRHRYAGRAIALTGYGMESDIAASRDAGFAEHLTKPVDLAALDAAIRRISSTSG